MLPLEIIMLIRTRKTRRPLVHRSKIRQIVRTCIHKMYEIVGHAFPSFGFDSSGG